MTCKGVCIRYKAGKPAGGARYSSGQRRCQICEIFIHWDGLWCPCCGYRLRSRPRNLKYKKKLRDGGPVVPRPPAPPKKPELPRALERMEVDLPSTPDDLDAA